MDSITLFWKFSASDSDCPSLLSKCAPPLPPPPPWFSSFLFQKSLFSGIFKKLYFPRDFIHYHGVNQSTSAMFGNQFCICPLRSKPTCVMPLGTLEGSPDTDGAQILCRSPASQSQPLPLPQAIHWLMLMKFGATGLRIHVLMGAAFNHGMRAVGV